MNNTYGNIRPSLINPATDVEIFYHYQPTMNSTDTSYENFHKIDDVTSILTNSTFDSTGSQTEDLRLPGMYKLSLPVSIFGRKGFYTIFIRPREYRYTIKDIGVLAAFPDIQGIVLDINDMGISYQDFSNDKLTGYRIEYYLLESEKLKRQEYYRLITSSNKVEPVTQTLNSASSTSNGYRFNDNGTLCFITVSPATSPNYKSSDKPYIGAPNQQIVISNTLFDPICVNVEICENDFDTLAISLDGNQIRALDNGLLTTYNEDNEIYKQWEFFTLKDNYTNKEKYEVKSRRTTNVDTSVDQDEVFSI